MKHRRGSLAHREVGQPVFHHELPEPHHRADGGQQDQAVAPELVPQLASAPLPEQRHDEEQWKHQFVGQQRERQECVGRHPPVSQVAVDRQQEEDDGGLQPEGAGEPDAGRVGGKERKGERGRQRDDGIAEDAAEDHEEQVGFQRLDGQRDGVRAPESAGAQSDEGEQVDQQLVQRPAAIPLGDMRPDEMSCLARPGAQHRGNPGIVVLVQAEPGRVKEARQADHRGERGEHGRVEDPVARRRLRP